MAGFRVPYKKITLNKVFYCLQMEIKKNHNADIERERTKRFLHAVMIVMAAMVVVMEWNDPAAIADDDSFLDDAITEMEIKPVDKYKDMIALVQKPQEQKSEKVKVVDKEVEMAPPVDLDTEEQQVQEQTDTTQNATKAVSPRPTDMDNPLNFRIVEDLPQFPGGPVEMMKWLTKNLKYPKAAQARKVQGRVLAQFTINTDGTVQDIKIVESLDAACDRETLRVLKMMPKWKPGIQDDQPCRTRVCIPVVFKL